VGPYGGSEDGGHGGVHHSRRGVLNIYDTVGLDSGQMNVVAEAFEAGERTRSPVYHDLVQYRESRQVRSVDAEYTTIKPHAHGNAYLIIIAEREWLPLVVRK
jgi:hypothetical protein